MKNKKLLLKSMMVLSLIFAISCKSNSNPDDTTTQTPPANQKTPVAIDIDAKSKSAKTTELKMELDGSTTKKPAEITFTEADASDAKLEVTGIGFVTVDPKNTTGIGSSSNTWEKLTDSDLTMADIELKKSGGKYTVAIKSDKVSGIHGKLTSKYAVIGVQVTAKKDGKEDKNLTFYVVVVKEG